MRILFSLLPLTISAGLAVAALPAQQQAGLAGDAPPRDVRLVEKKYEQLANRDLGAMGTKALAIVPAKWKHAETDNFIVHYRRVTEAQRAVREIEYALWYVAKTFGATKEQYARKSHVFIFQDEKEWKQFLVQTVIPQWSASFARGDELFLHVGGMGEGFDSHLVAHETTHAVVARLYPRKHWPVWLNEGFAEYMGSACVAARKGQYIKGLERNLTLAGLSFDQLIATTEYPQSREEVRRFYQSSEKVVRFLMTEFPKQDFPKFAEAMLGDSTFESAVVAVYGKQVKDFDAFKKKYERFEK